MIIAHIKVSSTIFYEIARNAKTCDLYPRSYPICKLENGDRIIYINNQTLERFETMVLEVRKYDTFERCIRHQKLNRVTGRSILTLRYVDELLNSFNMINDGPCSAILIYRLLEEYPFPAKTLEKKYIDFN